MFWQSSNSKFHLGTGVKPSSSQESFNHSDDDKRRSKETDSPDTQSDSSAKEIFKTIRTRYLTRVHSMSDTPTPRDSIVDQAFYRLNSVPEPKSDLNDSLLKELRLDISNVTTDETNDDDSRIGSADNSEDFQTRVLAEVDLLPFDKESSVQRQNAFDKPSQTINRQNAIDDFTMSPSIMSPSPDIYKEDDEFTKENDVKFVTKSESADVFKKSRDKTLFSRSLSGLYNGKPKSYSMDDLHTGEFKEVLKEATSVEFLGNLSYYSDLSLFTDGSDSVFASPKDKLQFTTFKKSPNLHGKDEVDSHKESIENSPKSERKGSIPVVKAESILPYPYPGDVLKERPTIFQPLDSPKIVSDAAVERDLKNVSEELKLTFKAAIDRIIGINKVSGSPVPPKREKTPRKISVSESDKSTVHESRKIKNLDNIDSVAVKHNPVHLKDVPIQSVDNDSHVEKKSSDTVREESPTFVSYVTKEDRLDHDKNETNVHEKLPIEENNSPADEEKPGAVQNLAFHYTNPFKESIKSEEIAEVDASNNSKDIKRNSVSYHLKINTVSDPSGEPNPVPKFNEPSNQRFMNKFRTFLTPINIVEGNIQFDHKSSSPVVLSPVLIQPIFFKPNVDTNVNKNSGTVYYDDIDQVLGNQQRGPTQSTSDDRKKGFYQKNIKAKHLPFLSWKAFGSVESLPENRGSKSPSKVEVERLSRSPGFLIDNQYYQPVDNVPFVINTMRGTAENTTTTNPEKIKRPPPLPTGNPFFPPRKQSEPENYYEEIGQPLEIPAPKAPNKNVADDDKISTIKQQSVDFNTIPREEMLKVPRKPKKPKKSEESSLTKPAIVISPKIDDETTLKEISSITKSIISLSRSPSAKEVAKPAGNVSEIIHSLESKPSETPERKLSLQNRDKPKIEENTGSLPREKKYHWMNLGHKRLSHPLRTLKDPPPARPLRKLRTTY